MKNLFKVFIAAACLSPIGIRKAIGATRGAIVLQFLLEAMTLTFFGGIVGVTLAVAISQLIILLIPSLPASIPMWAVISGLTVSVGVGLVFGVLPARKASKSTLRIFGIEV